VAGTPTQAAAARAAAKAATNKGKLKEQKKARLKEKEEHAPRGGVAGNGARARKLPAGGASPTRGACTAPRPPGQEVLGDGWAGGKDLGFRF
jgi:hypothetical protein